MSHALRSDWTEAAFFAWHQRQERRHELVDGQPRAMTGANNRHNRIALNVLFALSRLLPPGPCRPMLPADTAVRIPAGNIRYPDLVVDGGPYRPNDHAAAEPVLVVEVLSPSTRSFDGTRKVEEYRTVPSLRHILLLDPDAPQAQLLSRGDDGPWRWQMLQGEAATIAMPALGVTLPLAACLDDAAA
jgi:Uma2 family endonuclease